MAGRRIFSFPHNDAFVSSLKISDMNKIGFYAGSFDPFTRGHLSIVCEALCLFDKVIVGIGNNPSKRPVFDLSERQSMIRQTFEDWQDSFRYCRPVYLSCSEARACARLREDPFCIEIVAFEGLTIDAAIKAGADTLIRGERIIGDHDSEMQLSILNRDLLAARHCHLNMVTIPVPKESLTYVSSSTVKSLFACGEYIAAYRFVTPSVHNAMCRKYLRGEFPSGHFLNAVSETCGEKVYDEHVVRSYCAGNRYYHNLSHIGYCLNYLNFLRNTGKAEFADFDALKLALFFHDIVNGVAASEEKSAAVLRALQPDHQPETDKLFEDAARLIMNTRHDSQQCSDCSEDAKLLHDVDLLILADDENYDTYAGLIAREYSSACSREAYVSGRRDFLSRLLKSDIFRHPLFKKFEAAAKSNLKRELFGY